MKEEPKPARSSWSSSLFDEAYAKLPLCCLDTLENLRTYTNRLEDLRAAVKHELFLYAEGQDGSITADEQKECIEYLRWLEERVRFNMKFIIEDHAGGKVKEVQSTDLLNAALDELNSLGIFVWTEDDWKDRQSKIAERSPGEDV